MAINNIVTLSGTATSIATPVGFGQMEIVNIAGTAPVFYTTDGTTPVTTGSSTTRVIPAAGAVDIVNIKTDGTTVIKALSSGTPTISVQVPAGREDD